MGARTCVLVLGVIGLILFVIPIRKKIYMSEIEKLFNEYIDTFNKTYRSNETEYLIRMENFKQSLMVIQELNKNRSSNSSALYGLTPYADMSQNEFKDVKLVTNYSNFRTTVHSTDTSLVHRSDLQNIARVRHNYNFLKKRATKVVPHEVDWRRKNVIGSVHNQGACGACWAFSTVETIESMNAIKNGTFLPLSVQEAIDCARDGNYGCEGGDSCSLLSWLVNTETKLTTERAYPFVYHTQPCKVPDEGVQVKNYKCEDFIGGEELLLEKLANHGPVAAAVNAINWQYYLGGIIQFHCSDSPQDMNHAVQIVGYDKTGPVPFYIVRNSWGLEFGDKGYLYIAIGGNICGIANEVSWLDV